MNEAISLSEKDTYTTVKFSFPEGSQTYTDWSSDVPGDDGLLYVSTPSMEVKLPINNGILNNDDSAACQIILPRDDFLQVLGGGLPFAPVHVTVREFIRSTTPGARSLALIPFQGRLTNSFLTYQGKPGQVALSALPAKSRLNIPLGVPCDPQCGNTLGDANCKAIPFSDVGSVDAIDGKILTITGLPLIVEDDRLFHRGFVSKGGLNMLIRDWRLAEQTTFYMAKQAPDSWLGGAVTVVGGCDKSIQTCIARFDNEENFKGLGIAIPPYHPILESGD